MVPPDFTLTDRNERLPNRNGKVFDRDLRDVNGRGDVKNVACMTNCPVAVEITSSFPANQWGSNGNLEDQNRLVGPVRGMPRAILKRRSPLRATMSASG